MQKFVFQIKLKNLNGKKLDKESFLMKAYLYFRLYREALKQAVSFISIHKIISLTFLLFNR
jgi:hypothetical protein